ncbi:hypothetical protein N657DRAFT_664059 [Parathielavia appendiculata]|uniref:Aminoglycoside phosphotransferase domain-containing protein n=1 Tax=Parathielavia appendiculata TaxID=2587402 RepID=A0AAN6U0J7_9PEZI|nr:hypothetical protein N657DRAFT_664059 [Parathielavia appendiculata]
MVHSRHVRDWNKQIDETSWLIGSKHIIRHVPGPCEANYIWKNDKDGSCYILSEEVDPVPDAGPLPPDGHVRQIHDAGDASAVFSFSDALILKSGLPMTHSARCLFHTEEAGKVYLLEPYVPGKRLNEAWWDIAESEKGRVVTRVAEIASKLKAFQSDALTSVDYGGIDPFQEQRDYSVEALQRQCESLGMDCPVLVPSHNDLGTTNIIINEARIAVLDWELAGYCPLAWVRTKFAVCAALHTDSEYRVRVEQKLGEMGFPEVKEEYKKMETERLLE